MGNAEIDKFIERWELSGGSEQANSQSFLNELCDILEAPRPEPTKPVVEENLYAFERDVTITHSDGTTRKGRIDLYKRGCFVLESKQGVLKKERQLVLTPPGLTRQLKKGAAVRFTKGWDEVMMRAMAQAEEYVRALPAADGRPPFIVVVDVGHSIELYSEFSCSGGTYVAFPEAGTHRISLTDLAKPEIRERLRLVWTDPLALDPSRRAAKVTRDIAEHLAALARSLEADNQSPGDVAQFLMRCLFTMFAEDVGLLDHESFAELLESLREHPERFKDTVEELWQKMKAGGYSLSLRQDVRHFNGYLFAETWAFELSPEQLDLLIEAARADWRDVEPAIFGTLLERALDPIERHKLGAHYTPRAYVERLVMPTVMEPLRQEWDAAKAAALAFERKGKKKDAAKAITDFHAHLCGVKVLDPACGTGNFLYVSLEHFKRLEGEVLDMLASLGDYQKKLQSVEGPIDPRLRTVDPHQFLGLELNPRAAAIAKLVLWIGYLQWHFRTYGNLEPPEPIIKDFDNIKEQDAVLAWDRERPVLDDNLRPVTRWDGRTYKTSTVTGEPVPDETARVPVFEYTNPRKAEWPKADYVVGNPPFMGIAHMRDALGDGYTQTIRQVYDDIPGAIDYVLYWWNKAAHLARENEIKRFGFITTNSMRQTLNRRMVEKHLKEKKPLSIVFAIPDHPWVDESGSAAVRISMTVGQAGDISGLLKIVIGEEDGDELGKKVTLSSREGKILPGLTIGANTSDAVALSANDNLSCPGVKLHGAGFIVTPDQATQLGLGRVPGLENHIRQYMNGRDVNQNPRGVMVIDLWGLKPEEIRRKFPEVYQWIIERVKPEREAKANQSKDSQGYSKLWWLFGKPRQNLREALKGLHRYIATVETSKHRFFVFLDESILPDNMLVAVALDDVFYLGVLSSRVHVCWALAQGGTLEDRPRYNKTRCFETFPFPDSSEALKDRIRNLGESLDAHRKRQQELHPTLTMTAMYNVLEKLRAEEPLTDKEREINEQGLVSALKQIHDDLDAAVIEAYGWPADLGDEEILERLVALNKERAAEEADGLVKWLRPEFQAPDSVGMKPRTLVGLEDKVAVPAKVKKTPWPKEMPVQAKAVREALEALGAPVDVETVAKCFTRAPRALVAEILDTLATLGQARQVKNGIYESIR